MGPSRGRSPRSAAATEENHTAPSKRDSPKSWMCRETCRDRIERISKIRIADFEDWVRWAGKVALFRGWGMAQSAVQRSRKRLCACWRCALRKADVRRMVESEGPPRLSRATIAGSLAVARSATPGFARLPRLWESMFRTLFAWWRQIPPPLSVCSEIPREASVFC